VSRADEILAPLRELGQARMSSPEDIKHLQPVFAGRRLDDRIALTHERDKLIHFDLEALVEDMPVARGVTTAIRGFRLPVGRSR
jgi:hypothetical protein